jgi:hypothetical protein
VNGQFCLLLSHHGSAHAVSWGPRRFRVLCSRCSTDCLIGVLGCDAPRASPKCSGPGGFGFGQDQSGRSARVRSPRYRFKQRKMMRGKSLVVVAVVVVYQARANHSAVRLRVVSKIVRGCGRGWLRWFRLVSKHSPS